MPNCHMCEAETEWNCYRCDEPVCEDCCVVPTYENQLEESRCQECQDGMDASDQLEYAKEHERQEAIDTEKEKRRKKRREIYNRPENVEKRRLAKIERQLKDRELLAKQMADAVNRVNSMFRGMF